MLKRLSIERVYIGSDEAVILYCYENFLDLSSIHPLAGMFALQDSLISLKVL